MFRRLLDRFRRPTRPVTRRPAGRTRLAVEGLEDRTLLAAAPTAMEQLFLEQLNDARANPAAYGQSIGLNLSSVAPAAPLAFDARLIEAARLHSIDMNNRRFFDHTNPSGQGPGQRITASGFDWWSYGESIAAGYPTTASALSGLIIDQGVPNLGHRLHLLAMNNADRLVGIGVVQNGGGPYGNYYTIDTGNLSTTRPYLTGVAFDDRNRNNKYDVGEGLGGVTVSVPGVGSVVTWASGGYSIAVPPGQHTVTTSGPGMGVSSRIVNVGSQNVRLNLTPPTVTTVQLAATVFRAAEHAGRAVITLTRGGAVGAATWVRYSVSAGTATANVDFRPVTGVVAFAPNQRSATFVVSLLDDGLREGGETVNVVLTGVTGGQLAAVTRAALIIADNEPNDNGYFISGLNRDLLGRAPTAAVLAARQEALDRARAVGLAPIANQIVNGEEYRRLTIRNAYLAYLGRAPLDAELSAWLTVWNQQAAQGFRTGWIAVSLISTDEYRNRHPDAGTGQPSDEAWLASAFRDILGRAPTAAELSTLLPLLPQQNGESQVATRLWFGTEGTARRIAQAWEQHLLQPVPVASMTAWLTALGQGRTEEQLIVGLTASDAALELRGDTTASWLNHLYQTLLERAPRPDETDRVLQQVSSAYAPARLAEARALTATAAYANWLLASYYRRFTGRPASAAVLAAMTQQYLRGATQEQVIAGVIGSPGYYADPANGRGTPRGWVYAMFVDLLGRAPRPDETARVVGALSAGASRTGVAMSVMRGVEWRIRLVAGYNDSLVPVLPGHYRQFLRRPATSADLSWALGLYRKGLTNQAVVGYILSSFEYFKRPHRYL